MPWAVVSMPGCPEVIYVNCCDGGVTTQLLNELADCEGAQQWLELPNSGGPGGGARHPRGIILIGPAGVNALLSRLRPGMRPDSQETMDKLRQGWLRLLPPTPFFKMCGVYRDHHMSGYKEMK